MSRTIMLIQAGDWRAAYDMTTGNLITQGHSVDPQRLLLGLGHHVIYDYWDQCQVDEYLFSWGEFPTTFVELNDNIRECQGLDVW